VSLLAAAGRSHRNQPAPGVRRAPEEVACGEQAHDRLGAGCGLALALGGFSALRNDLLAGNFGNRRISAFDPATGAFLGLLEDPSGHLVTFNGLCGLAFDNGALADDTTALFVSGPTAKPTARSASPARRAQKPGEVRMTISRSAPGSSPATRPRSPPARSRRRRQLRQPGTRVLADPS